MNKIDRAEALAIFHELDKAMNFEKPRTAARKTFSYIFDSLDVDCIDVEEVMVLTDTNEEKQ